MNEKRLRAAATDLGENVMWLIEQVLVKHNMAIIEASKEAVDAAVLAEREACAVIAFNAKTYIEAAKAIRARGQE